MSAKRGRVVFAVSIVLAGLAAVAACASDLELSGGSDPSPDGGDAAQPSNDAQGPDGGGDVGAPDVVTKTCDLTKPFGTPEAIVELNTSGENEQSGHLTADELTIVFHRGLSLHMATRTSRSAKFGPAARITSVEAETGAGFDTDPMVSADGMRLFFTSNRGGGTTNLYEATRNAKTGPFAPPVAIAALSTDPWHEYHPFYAPVPAGLWFVRNENTVNEGPEIFFAAETSRGVFAEGGTRIAALSSAVDDTNPTPSADGRTIYFGSRRDLDAGPADIWVATRSSTTTDFGTPTRVSELGIRSFQEPSWLSPDGCRLYFHAGTGNNGSDLFIAEKPPL